jgi:hypothetical protein
MLLIVSSTVGFLAWIILWSLGVKSFDAFLLTVLIVVVAATVKMALPSLPGNRPSVDE